MLPIPGVTGSLRDGVKFKYMLMLQVHGRNTMKELVEAQDPVQRYNLHCQMRQINETLGIPTQSLDEITDELDFECALSLGQEHMGEELLKKVLGKHAGSTKGRGK